MKNIIRNIKKSPKTSLMGLGVILTAILPLVGVPVAVVTGIASALGGVGLLLSKDAGATGV